MNPAAQRMIARNSNENYVVIYIKINSRIPTTTERVEILPPISWSQIKWSIKTSVR